MDELFPNEANVTDAQKQALRDALLDAYPDFDFLFLRLQDKWGTRVNRYIKSDDGDYKVSARIVDYASGEGRFLDLLAVTWTDKPLNTKLKPLAEELLINRDGVVAKYAPAPAAAQAVTGAGPSLEKLIENRSTFLDIPKFVTGIEVLAGALCRISLKPSTEFELKGTGFLIGRQHVLTNYHVMKQAIEGPLTGDRIRLEFDYAEAGLPTTPIAVAPGLTWNVSKRPYSQSDLTGIGQPAPGELDYALIKLASAVPAERLQLTLPSAPPIVSQRDFIVIGQHPKGDPAKIAFGEVLAYPGSGLRYRYDAATLGGSSGSPVLTLNQDLVALHHAGDPQYKPIYNQGVPIWLIMEALKGEDIDLAAL